MNTAPSMQPDKWIYTGSNYERALGNSEAAFYPASQSGLGDMFLHLAFTASTRLMDHERVALAWAIIRKRHPLLLCKVVAKDPTIIPYFSFTPPVRANDALLEAKSALIFNNKTKEELIFEYMNGPRALSDDHLSSLTISTGTAASTQPLESDKIDENGLPGLSPDDETSARYDLLMCAPHFLGDGTSLHLATHDLLKLLSSSSSNSQLLLELDEQVDWMRVLPPGFETRLDVPTRGFSGAVSKVDFIRALGREIGGHTLSRNQRGPQRTVLHELNFSQVETEQILRICKSRGVTVNHAIVAICNAVWARNIRERNKQELPIMMYTAVNLRPHLSSHPTNTYWFVALTYFNIILPAFPPSTQDILWHRARDVKNQIRKMVESPFLKSRALQMANIRVARSRGQGKSVELPSLSALAGTRQCRADDTDESDATKEGSKSAESFTLAPAPSAALLGLSLIGNLDTIYDRSAYNPTIDLISVTTASRQKAAGLLLLEHTFGKKLWLHLCWDENGFEKGHIEQFWNELPIAVRELLL